MNTKLLLLAGFALMLALFVWSRLGKTSSANARRLVAEGALLLDVRTKVEFDAGHLPNAINIPVQDLPARTSELHDKSKAIVVYCASGMRSARAKRMLVGAGYQVHDLGSMSRW